MNTVVNPRPKPCSIGPDQPFVIIGERINPRAQAAGGRNAGW
ncbi:MAG: hypothetical protein R2911_38665 [Caldilineaceae bacterium]